MLLFAYRSDNVTKDKDLYVQYTFVCSIYIFLAPPTLQVVFVGLFQWTNYYLDVIFSCSQLK